LIAVADAAPATPRARKSRVPLSGSQTHAALRFDETVASPTTRPMSFSPNAKGKKVPAGGRIGIRVLGLVQRVAVSEDPATMPKRLTSYPAEESAPGRSPRSTAPVSTLQRKAPPPVEIPVTWPRSFTLVAEV
jgi:hypothetical protein